MIELILAAAAQQATGIPAEVWIAIIGAISGSLIKPIFDLISQRISVQREAEEKQQQEAAEKAARLNAKIKDLEQALEAEKQEAYAKVAEARDEEGVWREKYFQTLERFSKAYQPEELDVKNIDLSDPNVLRDIIKHIAGEK